MNIVGMDTQVVSSYGNIVTYAEHCQRLAAYVEEIKEKALLLTQHNQELTEYIQSLKLIFFEELYIEKTGCFHFVSVESPYSVDMPPRPAKIGKWANSAVLDENGHPTLIYDFLHIIHRFRERLLADIIIPTLVKEKESFISFLKIVIFQNTLNWNYLSEEKRGNCYELLFQHNEPDRFWLVIPNKVRVLIGTFNDIESELATSKERHMNSSLLIVDMDRQLLKDQETYSKLVAGISNKRTDVWSYGNFISLFDLNFSSFTTIINKILKIGTDNTYKLGELFSSTENNLDELVRDIKTLPTGNGKAYEELVKRILDLCFANEFSPFKIKEQEGTHNKKRIRDFIIDNRNPRIEFWRDLKSVRGVEKILLDAKNYKNPVEYTEITSTLRYLRNKAFGNFIIIISRFGVKDYEETIEDYAEEGRVILYLSDEDLIAMINLKKEGKSPTLLLEEKYYDFLDKK